MDHRLQLRSRTESDAARLEVRQERSVDAGAVLIDNSESARQRRACPGRRRRREQRERWGKQEELDAIAVVEAQDLRHDAERRVIHDHAALWVLLVLIVAARVERADELVTAQPVGLLHITDDGVIHRRRSVAVICGFLELELLEEFLVLFVLFRDLAARHAFLEFSLHALDFLLRRLAHGRIGRWPCGVPCHVDAPVAEVELGPVLAEHAQVPGAERAVVLEDDLLQLGNLGAFRKDGAHDVRPLEVLGRC